MVQWTVDATAIEAEIEHLRSMPIVELRALWRAKFKSDPPQAFGPDLLRRSIAYKIQEDVFGGLDRTIARLLRQLIEQFAKNNGRIVLHRRIKPGAVLIREWKGERHQVTVLADGFVYRDKSYESLSQIARLITGTRWNGLAFIAASALTIWTLALAVELRKVTGTALTDPIAGLSSPGGNLSEPDLGQTRARFRECLLLGRPAGSHVR